MRNKMIRRSAFRTAALVATTSLLLSACGAFSLGQSAKSQQKVAGERVSVLNLDDTLSVDEGAKEIDIRLPEVTDRSDWPQPGGNTTHSLGHLGLDGNLKVVKKINMGKGTTSVSRLTASPIMADGKIFTLDARARVTAVDAATGKRLWKVNLTPKKEKAYDGAGGGLAFDIGRVFVATGFGEVIALDASSGDVIWKRSMIVPFHTAPTAAGGRVYVTGVNDQIHALSAFDGASLWSYRGLVENEGIFTDTNPAVFEDLVVAPFSSGEVVGLLAQNGRQTWSDALTRTGRLSALSDMKMIAARPVIDRGQVIAVSHSGRLVAIDIRSGERIWSRNVASIKTPWVAGNVIYVTSLEGQVMALSRRDGRVIWITQLKSKLDRRGRKPVIWSGPILAGNQLLVASSHGHLVTLSPFTGGVTKDQKIGAGVYTSPMLVDGKLYFYNNKGTLVVLKGNKPVSEEAMRAVPTSKLSKDGSAKPQKKSGGWFNLF
ncbi:MAG: pyrrolo-quinoline quinone [Alphaproteobacteria bacterium]|nr:MAG: pyrrolo-quinoline quinone [Alphaproteobacteria bacterium]